MDEIYIKMCKEAEEIQDLWVPHNLHCLSVIITKVDFENGRYNATYPMNEKFWKHLGLDELIWLPRQEDLQKIWIEKENTSFEGIMEDMFLFYNSPDTKIDKYTSIDAIWLDCVMYYIYGKEWDFGKMEWVAGC